MGARGHLVFQHPSSLPPSHITFTCNCKLPSRHKHCSHRLLWESAFLERPGKRSTRNEVTSWGRLTCRKEEVPRLIITPWIKMWSAIWKLMLMKASESRGTFKEVPLSAHWSAFTLLNESDIGFYEHWHPHMPRSKTVAAEFIFQFTLCELSERRSHPLLLRTDLKYFMCMLVAPISLVISFFYII